MADANLTAAQLQVLRDFTNSKRYEEGLATAQWVAESCGHAYDTPWATSNIAKLTKRGLVERVSRGVYRITSAGVAAIAKATGGQ